MSEELAYLAGFFDGEGSIHLQQPTGGLQINAAQVDQRPLVRLRSLFGGTIRTQHRATGRPVSYWVIYGAEAAKFLLALQPWLVVKQAQVGVALRFAAMVKPRGYNARLTDVERLARQALIAEMRVLHAA